MDNLDDLIGAARDGIITVEYRNIYTNEIRKMPCTLNSRHANTKLTEVKQNGTSEYIAVYALDRKDWRSFQANTIIQWYYGVPRN